MSGEPVREPAVPVAAAAALAAGVVAGRHLSALAPQLTVAACGFLGTAVGLRSRGRVGLVLVLVGVVLAGAANAGWRAVAAESRMLPDLAAAEAFVTACGTVVVELPRSAEVSARSVRTRTEAWRTAEPLLATGEEARRLRSGERVCLEGVLRPPRPGFGGPPALRVEEVERLGVGSPLRWAASGVRARFHDAATAVLPERQAGLLLGMTTGNRRLLAEETVEAFRTTGLAHLVAVSGFHVGVVLGLLLVAARALVPRGRWIRVAVAGPPLVFFAFLAGLAPSVLRAVVTAGIVLVVTASGRVSEGLRVAAMAFLLLVFVSPDLLFQAGFQMSFAATVGLILWSRSLAAWLARLRLPGPVADLAAAALAAQLGVAPVLAAHFGQIPAAGGLANLLAVPLAPVVIGGGLATLSLASLWSGLAWAPATLRLPLDAILWVAETFAELPAASVDVGLPAAAALSAAAGAALARSPRTRVVAVALALVCASAAGGRVLATAQGGCAGAEVRAVDIGQGTAVLLRSAEAVVVADGGPKEGKLVPKLRALGVRRVDAIVASHPHADHTEGLVDVLEAMPVGVVLAPATIGWGVGRDVVETAAAQGVPLVEATTGQAYRVGDVTMHVLSPDDGPIPDEDPSLINAYNLVVRAEVDGVDVLLPGDADGRAQMLLVSPALRAEVLVAPHHGSADVDPGFVEAVDPQVTLVTVGAHNQYGHPAEVAMRLYELHGPVFRTDTQGDVALCTNGGALEVRTQR